MLPLRLRSVGTGTERADPADAPKFTIDYGEIVTAPNSSTAMGGLYRRFCVGLDGLRNPVEQ
ncbi:MAG: hypothetical protein OXI73_16550 [Rhodospirillales bacterium]|nr:hypothetical protein [Rhodospirillales bacterium]